MGGGGGSNVNSCQLFEKIAKLTLIDRLTWLNEKSISL